MTQGDEITAVATRFLGAFSDADFETLRSLLAPDLAAWVTNAGGGADRLDGRDEYLARIEAMDLPSARFSVELTQPPVAVAPITSSSWSRCAPSAAAGRFTTSQRTS